MKKTSQLVAALLLLDSSRAIKLNSSFPANIEQADESMMDFMSK